MPEANKMSIAEMGRDGYCRGCDELIERGIEPVMHTYSARNRGMHIYLCRRCCEEIAERWEHYDNGTVHPKDEE